MVLQCYLISLIGQICHTAVKTPGRDTSESVSWLTILLNQGSSLQHQDPIHITPTRTLTHRQLARIPIQQVHTLEPLLQDMVPLGPILMVIINLSLVHYSSPPSQLPPPRRRRYLRVLSELPLLPIILYTLVNLPQLPQQLAPPLAVIKNSLTSKGCSLKSVRSVSPGDCRLLITNDSF